ncbi:MAG: chorismate synthase [Dissulfuribacterales bacterium]
MPGNTFGHSFRVTTWGESHGPAIGVVIDGCPARLPLSVDFIQAALDKRRPGKGGVAETTRKEPDRVEILSGVFKGLTTGTPICLVIYNKDAKSSSYDTLRDVFRPGHGDMTYLAKYGIRDHRGGGRASGRETAARVAAGAVAQLVLDTKGIEVIAHTVCLGGIWARRMDKEAIEKNRIFCADEDAANQIEELISTVRSEGDSLGGIVEILAQNVPAGLGEPVFDKLDADLAKALMSIGAVKGVEIGAGFQAAFLRGSENNDAIGPGGFLSNNAGGILAGISNGDQIVCRAAVKPIPSISLVQQTVNTEGEPVTVKIGGRHDASAIPRIVPVCQAMVRLVLADHLLRQKAISL